MSERSAVIEEIRRAFAGTPYPGDAYIQGSREGCEPFEEVGAFVGQQDWRALDAAFLDAHYGALNFFSEAGLRFFLPAYLIADLEGKLATADPVFHLTHGFTDATVDIPIAGRVFTRRLGGSVLLNPRRYGAMTFQDHARCRLSVFTREEASAIVAYLGCRREAATTDAVRAEIDAALEAFWLERAAQAPAAESLARHLAEEAERIDYICRHADSGMTDAAP